MGKIIAAALVAVIAVDSIKFDGELYAPGSTVAGLTPEQAEGLVANGHSERVAEDGGQAGGKGDGSGDANSTAPNADTASGQPTVTVDATTAPAAKAPAAKPKAKPKAKK